MSCASVIGRSLCGDWKATEASIDPTAAESDSSLVLPIGVALPVRLLRGLASRLFSQQTHIVILIVVLDGFE
jgi:hypothetical protein